MSVEPLAGHVGQRPGGLAILMPLLADGGSVSTGAVMVGTLKSEVHHIGKNLISMTLVGAGFEVTDLGVDCRYEF